MARSEIADTSIEGSAVQMDVAATHAVPGESGAERQAQPLPDALLRKQSALFGQLRAHRRVIVALSGGVDSSYLAWAGSRTLGDDCLAVTAVSPSYPDHHRAMVDEMVARFGIRHRYVETHEMESADYRANRADRCYHCKSELFTRMDALMAELGYDALAYGINLDDRGDHRPGHRAAAEHHVLSPLLDARMGKADIRALSQAAGLPCWDMPASACLASRLPYGSEVTPEKLRQVELGEARLRDLGFRQLRLRHHGDVARIEIESSELARAHEPEMARAIVEAIRPLGFRWVCVDLEGYRSGSLNDALKVIG